RLAAGHEQPVPPRPAEAHVGAGLRHPNHADAISVRSDHLNAGPCSRPDIAVHVASNAIGERRRPGPRHVQLDEPLAVAQRCSVDVPHRDVARCTGIGDIELPVVGREAETVWLARLIGHLLHLTGFRIHTVNRFLGLGVGLEPLVVSADAVDGFGEPDAAVRMHDDVVGGVQPLALILVGDYGDGPGRLVPDDATAAVLARELPALVVERVAVAVPGRVTEDRDVAVLFNPAHLDVVGDVAPDQVPADSVPGRTFGPQRA